MNRQHYRRRLKENAKSKPHIDKITERYNWIKKLCESKNAEQLKEIQQTNTFWYLDEYEEKQYFKLSSTDRLAVEHSLANKPKNPENDAC